MTEKSGHKSPLKKCFFKTRIVPLVAAMTSGAHPFWQRLSAMVARSRM
jgi:hypothetical protein